MTNNGKTKRVIIGNPKFKNTITYEEVKGRNRSHLVVKGNKKKGDPLRRRYSGWVCIDCDTRNYFLLKSCSRCGGTSVLHGRKVRGGYGK